MLGRDTQHLVLMDYLPADFQTVEKPKGGPLEIENFFVEGVNKRGWMEVRGFLKPYSSFLTNKNIKFENLLEIIHKYQHICYDTQN